MAGGGVPTQTTGGTSIPTVHNWKTLLPPWTQTGQQVMVPWLVSKVFGGGMTPTEEKQQWGSMVEDVDQAASTARKSLVGRWVGGGAAMNSPAYNAAKGAIDIDRMAQIRKAAADVAKVKLGAQDTATKNVLTGLYANVPSLVANYSTQSGSS